MRNHNFLIMIPFSQTA